MNRAVPPRPTGDDLRAIARGDAPKPDTVATTQDETVRSRRHERRREAATALYSKTRTP